MVRLLDEILHISINDYMESFFKSKGTDCILYSEDGIEFNIHKEVLGQTDFLRSILLSSNDCGYKVIQIFCPCSKNDLEYMVKFLYSGTISCNTEGDIFEILDNLSKIFGFPKERFLPEDYSGLEKEFEITNSNEKEAKNLEIDPTESIHDIQEIQFETIQQLEIDDEKLIKVETQDFSIEFTPNTKGTSEKSIFYDLEEIDKNCENDSRSTFESNLELEEEENSLRKW